MATTTALPTPGDEPGREGPTIPFGFDAETGETVHVPLSVFGQHGAVRGMTGAGKNLVMAYLMYWFIRLSKAAVISVGFGFDFFTSHWLRNTAADCGRPYCLFSSNPEHDSLPFHPLRSVSPLTETRVVPATNYLLTALSLDSGGAKNGYWDKVNAITLLRATSLLESTGVEFPTLKDYVRVLSDVGKNVRKQDAVESLLAIEEVARYPQLSPGVDDPQIDYDTVLEEGHVVDLQLNVLADPPALKMGALHVWSAVQAAIRRVEAGKPKRDVFIVIDEAAAVIGGSKLFRDLIVLARKFGVRLLLAYQSENQLRLPNGIDLRHTVFENTAFKFYLTTLGDDIDVIRDLSKDVWKQRKGQSLKGKFGVSNQISEYLDPEIERNDVLGSSFLPLHGWLILFGGEYRAPRLVHFEPPWSIEEHAKLANTPLPVKRDVAPLPGFAKAAVPADEPTRKARHEAIRKLLSEKARREQFQAG